MAVTNYTPNAATCSYSYSKLRNTIYLVSKDHLKEVFIDNGEAYISGLTETPMRIDGFNLSLNEETSLDERYKFQKTVTISMHSYVNSSVFNGKYYVILQSYDNTFWMVNVDFPSRVTYTFNLAQNQYQTDFTLSSLSNFPTLKLNADFDMDSSICLGYNIYGIQSLKLLEKDYCGFDSISNKLYRYTSKPFQDIKYLGQSCSLQETFDGETTRTSITFDIGFDAYKSSWHYNLLEFVQNLYSAIIEPKGGDKTLFLGFNFGLQPSYVVQTQSQAGSSDIITITLVESSNHGSTAASDWSEIENTNTKWIYPKTLDNLICYECVGVGLAKYLVQQEVTVNGTPTGNYKVLEGYENQFPNLNIIGTFSNVETFDNPECGGASCAVSTNLPITITYHAQTCYTYSYSAACSWSVSDLPSYITVSPSSGAADSAYTLTICNTKTPTDTETSNFKITSGDNTRIVNVVLTTDTEILSPQTANINCLQQNVSFTYDSTCPITVTSIDSRLTYQINNSQLIVNVPRNNSVTSAITWNIGVKDCHNDSGTSQIIQDKTYEKWVDTSDYLCESGDSYVKQARYTGTTSANTNTLTGEYRKGSLIQSGDSRCGTVSTRWTRNASNYYCIDGDKWSFDEEEVSYDGGQTWTKNGNTRLGAMVESASSFCSESVEYKWVLTDYWQCGYTPSPFNGKFRATYSGGTTYSAECDSNTTLTTATTKPSGYVFSAMTSAEIGDCVATIGYGAFHSMYDGTSLTSVTMPDSVTSIGSYAFIYCDKLTSIDLPNNLTTIGSSAFWYCSSLTSIDIPSGVTSIGGEAFLGCIGLSSITVDSNNTNYDSRNNCNAIIETSTNKLIQGCNNTVIPNNILSIEHYAFVRCSGLTSVSIPSGVTSIGYGAFDECVGLTSCTFAQGSQLTSIGRAAFQGCTSLTSITIPSGVTSISDFAFNGCRSLTSVTILDSVTSIGENAFASCDSFTSITIPSGVTSIGYQAFYGCNSLTSITVNATTPPTLGENAFINANNCPIYVPCSSVAAYKAASGWSTYASRIQGISPCGLPSGYTEVEYIQSNSTSKKTFMKLDYHANNNTRVVADMQLMSGSPSNPRFFGCGWFNGLGYIANIESGYYNYKFGLSSSWYQTSVSSDFNRHIFDFNNNGEYYIDSTLVATLPTTSFTSTDNFGVMGYLRNGSSYDANEAMYGRMYSFKLYDNGTLMYDLVPCVRNSDNTVGAYDLVNNVFYDAYVNGPFIAGPTV